MDDKSLYQLLGRLEGKIDTINAHLENNSKKFDSVDVDLKDKEDRICRLEQTTSKHTVWIGLFILTIGAIIVTIVRKAIVHGL